MDHPLLGREELGTKLFLYLDIEFIELLQTLRSPDIVHLGMVPGGGRIQTWKLDILTSDILVYLAFCYK